MSNNWFQDNIPKYKVVGWHMSKSIELPVISVDDGLFIMRDNFYGVNIHVSEAVDLPYDVFYDKHDQAWYEEQIEKCRSYAWESWSEEELLDPRITRVPRHGGWNGKSPEKKERWNNRLEDTAWWGDWSGGFLIKEDGSYYPARRAYCEGMQEYYNQQPYRRSTGPFTVAVGRDRVLNIIERVREARREAEVMK